MQHVYGEHEAGGTGMLYLSNVPLDQLGMPKPEELGTTPFPALTQGFLSMVPLVIVVWAGFLGGLHLLMQRRAEIAAAEAAAEGKTGEKEDQS